MNLKNILVRLVSGIIYIGLILGFYFLGADWFVLLCCIFGGIAVIEFTHITENIGSNNMLLLILDIICTVALIEFFNHEWSIIPWIITLLIRIPAQLYSKYPNPVSTLSLSILKQVYIGVGFGCMGAIAAFPNWLLIVLFIIWINDTGAYLVGSTLGRHPFFKRISPKKSWEGFVGGLILAVAAAIIFCTKCSGWFGLEPDLLLWIGLAVVTVMFATWGDLVESQLKRALSIKDSGNIIPGHGGILDRVDSLLLAMPAAWVYLYIFC